MALTGDMAVCIGTAARPSIALASWVSTSSALPWLAASTINRRASASTHTVMEACLVKAMGSSVRRASSLSSRVSFLPGLRPVATSIWAARSLVLRAMTEPGTTLVSVISLSSHCPSIDSASGPAASPRGGTQPTARSWVSPHSTNTAACSAASSCARDIDQPAPIRYTITFLNTYAPFAALLRLENWVNTGGCLNKATHAGLTDFFDV